MGKSRRQGAPEERDEKVIAKEDRRGRKRSRLYKRAAACLDKVFRRK
ncbi:hypothetical protein BACFIN_05657 [Bacteroides finegoldii DSM 17565]|nr:hypothetical protein BACFIN_05657 [Bacteroides finegoldii DSM 17565]